MPHVSIGGARYWVTVIDDHTKLAAVVPIQGKDETGAAVRRIVALWENSSGLKLGRMRSDRGGEYIETGLQVWLAEKGVQHEKTAPYSPQQNGTAERYNRTLEEHTVAMLADGNVDGKLWADAALTANYTLNRIPRRREAKTPYEMVFGMRPNVGHLRTFGCKAYVLTPGPLRRKLAQRTKMGTFIGYEAGSKAYRFLIGGRVVVRRDARFEEEDLYGLEGDSESSHEYSDEDDTDNTGPPGGGLGDAGDGAGSSGGGADGTNPPSEAMAAHVASNPDKMPIQRARKEADWPQFDAAVRAEVDSLWRNGTWVLADLPRGAKLLPTQMLCERKRGADGEVSRHKGRFVACGNHQVAGRDYTEVWAPVARHATLRALLSTAAAEGMMLYQLDVETAFLNGEVDEELYLQQPRGYE
eukprot:contig_21956_g5414